MAPPRAACVQLTKSLATAWAKDNIQVNAVLPGWIDTDLTQAARARRSRASTRMVLMRTPARRWGMPDDLSGIAVFLASTASDFVTGTAIPVDGGYSDPGVSGDPCAARFRLAFQRRRPRRTTGPQPAPAIATVSPLWSGQLEAPVSCGGWHYERGRPGAYAHERHEPDGSRHRDARQSLQPARSGEPLERYRQHGLADLHRPDGLPARHGGRRHPQGSAAQQRPSPCRSCRSRSS